MSSRKRGSKSLDDLSCSPSFDSFSDFSIATFVLSFSPPLVGKGFLSIWDSV